MTPVDRIEGLHTVLRQLPQTALRRLLQWIDNGKPMLVGTTCVWEWQGDSVVAEPMVCALPESERAAFIRFCEDDEPEYPGDDGAGEWNGVLDDKWGDAGAGDDFQSYTPEYAEAVAHATRADVREAVVALTRPRRHPARQPSG